MSEFTLTIQCDNAAFEDGSGAEIARILREIANKVEPYSSTEGEISVRDINGNTVGSYILIDTQEDEEEED